MASLNDLKPEITTSSSDGFVLESADSVRFGDEYDPEERERNRQILFGELLCGLLMGEPVWTNAIFAFDSAGMVQVLGAIARAFHRESARSNQHLPMIIAAYGGDVLPGQKTARPWSNPNEFFLRCYAHRLDNIVGFTASATPELDKDTDRRKKIAAAMIQHAESPVACNLDDLRAELKSQQEISHFRDLYSIDGFLRSWYGLAGKNQSFADYASEQELHGHPVRLIRDWTTDQPRFKDSGVKHLRRYCEQALEIAKEIKTELGFFLEAQGLLRLELENPNNDAFNNRTLFRKKIKPLSSPEVYNVLVELADGHYVRMQYTELTRSAREVTSPAGTDPAAALGEIWANATTRSLMIHPDLVQSWQFITKLKSRPSASTGPLDLDGIAFRFADFMTDPDRRNDLSTYQRLLSYARAAQIGSDLDRRKYCFDALYRHVTQCCEKINIQMNDVGVNFAFNPLESCSLTGSLTMSYLEHVAISQATGDADAAIDPTPSSEQPVSRGSDNALPSTL